MTENSNLVNLGELSKPATVLIERIADAIGGVFRPWQIIRIAQAEAHAAKIKGIADIEVSEMQQRAIQRFIFEEGRKQENIEQITAKALPVIEDEAKPNEIDEDWITNFFDKARLISDDEIQLIWAKVLAGEANSPGRFSKRTVSFLSSLDKSDAILFQTVCGYGWDFGNVFPLVYDIKDDIYKMKGITFGALTHLNEIGLLSFDSLAGFLIDEMDTKNKAAYYGYEIECEFINTRQKKLEIGHVLLSKVGQELAPICGSKPVTGFFDYIVKHWAEKSNIVVSVPITTRERAQKLHARL